MSAWRKHEGGECPVDPAAKVRVQLRCRSPADAERQEPHPAAWWKRWWHDGGPGDIVALARAD